MRQDQGFTLLELLIVMAVIAILAVLADFTFIKRVQDATNTRFIEVLAQDINIARSLAQAKSQRTQLTFTSLNSYSVTYPDLPLSTPAISIQSNPKVVLGNVNVGDKIICSSNGFCLGYTSSNALITINSITAAVSGQATRTLNITVLGLTRVEL